MVKLIVYKDKIRIICGFYLLFCSLLVYSKKQPQHELNRDWIYKKSNVYITAHPTFSPKPKITSISNPYNLNYSMGGGTGFNFGFVYMYNFSKNYGVSIGVNLALLSFRTYKFNYTLHDSISSNLNLIPNYCFKCREVVNHSTNFPIRFIYRKEVSKKIDLNLQVGLDIELQRSFLYIYGDNVTRIDSGYMNYFYLTFENNGNWTRSISPYFACSFGINQLLKNNHYINYQFSAHIPFVNPYTNGHFYILPGTAYEAKGTFKLMPYTFGLEVNYVFTFNRRKLRKEKNNPSLNQTGIQKIE